MTERSARPPSPSPPAPLGESQEIARAFAALANALDAALADLQSILRSRLTESARVALESADRIERAIWVAACFCSGGAGAVLGAIAGAGAVLWALR